MFNMGGPIKQGIMHGIREPYKHGGPTGTGLVGDKRYPKTDGRSHHLLPLAPIGMAALRFLPAAIRGFRAARAYQPWAKNLGWAQRAKDMLMLRGGISAPMASKGAGAGFRTGSFLRQNPITALSLAPQAGVAGYKAGKYLTTEAAPAVGKAYVDALVPGDSIFKEKTTTTDAPSSVPLNPNLQAIQDRNKNKTTGNAADFAKSQRDGRVNKYLKMMGYDTAKKTAIADALIDASKIVSDRGTLDRKNIAGELINPIIQATSKRLDKPAQIREAVGLMMTKADIEKDLEDPTVKALRVAQLEKLNKEASPSISETIMGYMASKKDDVKGKELVDLVRLASDKKNTPFKVITEEEVAKIPGMADKTALEIVSQTAETDGVYMVGDAVIEIIGGTPRQIK